MYNPPHFKEDKLEALHSLIKENPLGLLISCGDEMEPQATAIPFLLKATDSKFGLLQAHLARANQHCKNIDDKNVLVVFQGLNAYISPNWYPSKEEHGMVVPTWNYIMVQVRGKARIIDDAGWLKKQITAMTNQQEASRSKPWQVSDAPETYIDSQIRGIIGVEIEITQIDGKWKLSQNRSQKDRNGVVDNLEAEGKREIASLMSQIEQPE